MIAKASTAQLANSKEGELVLLVHGFLSKRLMMKPLEWRIKSKGFRTRNWGYLSFIGSIREHAKRLRQDLEAICGEEQTVHLVAHSMGSIVLRLALEEGPLPNLGRVVLLAPPNQGTPTARLLSPFVSWFCPGVAEISNGSKGVASSIQSRQALPIGIIAGDFDWIVPKSRTHLAGQTDHICLASTHNTLLVLPSAARHACEFLREGRFQ